MQSLRFVFIAMILTYSLSACHFLESLSQTYLSRRDTEERMTLKSVHLDGIGMLNQQVLVSGKVQMVGDFATYLVIEEDKVRMLVDLSKLIKNRPTRQIGLGNTVEVAGKVQTGENGHVYLVATALNAG